MLGRAARCEGTLGLGRGPRAGDGGGSGGGGACDLLDPSPAQLRVLRAGVVAAADANGDEAVEAAQHVLLGRLGAGLAALHEVLAGGHKGPPRRFNQRHFVDLTRVCVLPYSLDSCSGSGGQRA